MCDGNGVCVSCCSVDSQDFCAVFAVDTGFSIAFLELGFGSAVYSPEDFLVKRAPDTDLSVGKTSDGGPAVVNAARVKADVVVFWAELLDEEFGAGEKKLYA